jgi:NAD(P)-dependent dehydrogenase (short-subunit alcohol dehydrogenase family)
LDNNKKLFLSRNKVYESYAAYFKQNVESLFSRFDSWYLINHITEPIEKIKNAFPSTPQTDTRDSPRVNPSIQIKAGDLLGYTTGTPLAHNFDFGGYAGTKGAIIAFGKTLAREVARHRITVNTVCPGITETALLQGIRAESEKNARVIEAIGRTIPLGRIGAPEDVAAAVAFLASPEANYITGQSLSVSGGLTMV